MPITAKVIADSVSPQGHRLTTFELRYPKFIHGEFMTHRVFSRNASSSRAIPTAKYLEEVRSPELRAAPMSWGVNQKGMQAGEELIGADLNSVQFWWDKAARDAASWVELMASRGAHKQVVNRILEPFIHINVVVSATEYSNFFGLRLDAGADPTMRALAEAMWAAYLDSAPNPLQPGEWHLPYIECSTLQNDGSQVYQLGGLPPIVDDRIKLNDAIKVSVARCARVSYKSHETGKISTLEEDLALYKRLMGTQPLHASPAEHQATPDTWHHGSSNIHGMALEVEGWDNPRQHGNFVGWRQYRKMVPGESCAPLPLEYTKEKST